MKGVKRFVGHVESHVESGRGRLVRVGTTGVAVAAALSLLLILGCGKKESAAGSASSPAPAAAPATTPPAAAPAAQPAPAKAAKPVKGEVTKDKLPPDFPSDIPLPADLEPKSVFLAPGQGGLASFISKSSGDAVVQEFEKSLPGAGWTLEPTQKQPKRTLISATKAARKLKVIVMQASGHSEIMLTLQGG